MGKKSKSKFGDVRIDRAFGDLLEAMSSRYSVVLRQISDDHNEETRFQNLINNKKVVPDLLLEHHWSQSSSNWENDHVLVVSDTSTLSFPYRADREELGDIGGVQSKTAPKYTGFDIHPSIFVNASNGALQGLGGLDIIKTPLAKTKIEQVLRKVRQKTCSKLPFEQKERYKWLRSPIKAITNAPKAKQYTLVGDRETDIYDLIHRTLEEGHDFVYRSSHDRRVFNLATNKVSKEKFSDVLNRWTIEFSYDLAVQTTKHRSAHIANLQVKYGQILMAKPKTHIDKSLPTHIPIYIVDVKEDESTVFSGEKPVHWTLLTSHPVTNPQQAMQIIQWYIYRWIIEELFRTLKSKGLDIESSEVETFHALSNLATIALLAATQTMQLVRARGGKTKQQMSEVFFQTEQDCLILLNEKLEGKTEKTQNPFHYDDLAFGSWVIARLGGWKGYQSKKPPGPITITRGLIKFYQILEGFNLLL